MTALPIPSVKPVRRTNIGCEVVIFSTALTEKMLMERFRSMRKQPKSRSQWMLINPDLNYDFHKKGFTFFCPHHAKHCRPTDPEKEAEFEGALPQCTIWTVGNRVIMQRFFDHPHQVGWLTERKLSLGIAAPFIRLIRTWERERRQSPEIMEADKLGKGWLLIFPPKKEAYTRLLQSRIVTVRTSDSSKIPHFVARLRKRFIKMQLGSLENHLKKLNKIDQEGRRSRFLPDRPSPVF